MSYICFFSKWGSLHELTVGAVAWCVLSLKILQEYSFFKLDQKLIALEVLDFNSRFLLCNDNNRCKLPIWRQIPERLLNVFCTFFYDSCLQRNTFGYKMNVNFTHLYQRYTVSTKSGFYDTYTMQINFNWTQNESLEIQTSYSVTTSSQYLRHSHFHIFLYFNPIHQVL